MSIPFLRSPCVGGMFGGYVAEIVVTVVHDPEGSSRVVSVGGLQQLVQRIVGHLDVVNRIAVALI